jgi:hypothetical protein
VGQGGEGDGQGRRELERGREFEPLYRGVRRIGIRREIYRRAKQNKFVTIGVGDIL